MNGDVVKNRVSKKKVKKLTDLEKEQRRQRREIVNLMVNIGFKCVSRVDGVEFIYEGRRTEIDDIFYFENIIVLTEYTVGRPGDHLLKKNIFYSKVNNDKKAFVDFLLFNKVYKDFNEKFAKDISSKYSKAQLQVVIMYCSKQTVSREHKNLVDGVVFFDYHIVKYFESLSKVIKKSARYEFFDFLDIPFCLVADEVLSSAERTSHKFSGHILPEEHSSFSEGYKIVSFYIDAENLLKRAYVLRQNGWRDKRNIGHYQRMFINSKIKGMRKYLHEKERVFINNIIATISTGKIKLYDKDDNTILINSNGSFSGENTKVTPTKIEIFDETNIVGIVDGQHRTYAYHEGNDVYEETIGKFRRIQNLLVTGILYPADEKEERRLKFEANLFLEINANQSGAGSQLKQEIELMTNQFSTTSIAKRVLDELNNIGPLSNLLEQYWYEKGKLKTASIVSYGLRPLLKLDDERSSDSIFSIWDNDDKYKLKDKFCDNYDLLDAYVKFAANKICDIVSAFKEIVGSDRWVVERGSSESILTVTAINGILNTLRFIIENEKVNTCSSYKKCLDGIQYFDFKSYKSSQYRKMGFDIYQKYFI